MKRSCNKKGELVYVTNDVDEQVHRINISITPDKITKDQYFELKRFMIYRVNNNVQIDNCALTIISYFPRRSVSEIKDVAHCTQSGQESEISKAMLEYGDILWCGLKNVDQKRRKGLEYYEKAFRLGDPEAYIAVAIVKAQIQFILGGFIFNISIIL